jgi:hypothetical protein
MVEIRTFRVGDQGWVVAFRGALDCNTAGDLISEVQSLSGSVIVDLLGAILVDLDALDELAAAVGARATLVAERPLVDALSVVGLRRYVQVAPTLAAALA